MLQPDLRVLLYDVFPFLSLEYKNGRDERTLGIFNSIDVKIFNKSDFGK